VLEEFIGSHSALKCSCCQYNGGSSLLVCVSCRARKMAGRVGDNDCSGVGMGGVEEFMLPFLGKAVQRTYVRGSRGCGLGAPVPDGQ